MFGDFTGWFYGNGESEALLAAQPNEDKYYMLDREGFVFNTSMPFKMAEKMFIASICSHKILGEYEWEQVAEAEFVGIEI